MNDFDKVLQWIEDMNVKIENESDPQERGVLKNKLHQFNLNLKRTQHLIEEGGYYHFCKDCGEIEFATYVEPRKTKLKEHQLCFSCHLWKERSEEFVNNHGKAFIVDGVLWTDGGNKPNSRKDFLGCAGRVFKIRMLDGSKEWETNNLWCGGDIPKRYRDTVLKDTAEFIKE